jgi:hypothetical protein
VFTKQPSELIKALFPFDVELNSTNNVSTPTEIIFDANTLSFKDIISKTCAFRQNKHVTVKILPQNSSYIIGSNDSVNQGEIITFEEVS